MKHILIVLAFLSISLSGFAIEVDGSAECKMMIQFISMQIEDGALETPYEDYVNREKIRTRSRPQDNMLLLDSDIRKAYSEMYLHKINNIDPEIIMATCENRVGINKKRERVEATTVKTAGLTSKGLSTEVFGQMASQFGSLHAALDSMEKRHACDFAVPDAESFDCSFGSPMLSIPGGFRDYMFYIESKMGKEVARYSPEDCDCVKKDILKKNKNVPFPENEILAERDKLDKLIQRATGKKLINEYAALSEDLQYYATASEWVMKEGQATKVDAARLCQDPAGFEKAVQTLCAKNGTSHGSAERLSSLLGTFDNSLSKKPFHEGLQSLVKDISTFTFDSRDVTKGSPDIFTRVQYDKARQGISKKEPQLQVANDIITIMLLDEGGMKKILLDEIATGKSPMHGAMGILGNAEHARYILSKLEQKYADDNKAFKDLKSEIGTKKFDKDVDTIFHRALNLHPGFKNLLNDADLFKKTAQMLDSKDSTASDVLTVMNRDKRIFNAHMEARCKSVQEHFAEAVCTKPEDIRLRIGPQEILHISQTDLAYSPGSQDAKELALCRMSSNIVSKNSVYSNLSMVALNPYATSDYLDRKLHPDKQNNGLAKMAIKAANDKKFAAKLGEAVDSSDYARVGTGSSKSSGVNELLLGKNNSNHHVENMTSQLPAESSPVHKASSIAQPGFEQSNKSFAQSVIPRPAIAAPSVAAQAISEANSEEKKHETISKPSYERLAKELASSENKAKVSSHLNNINEADAQEILRLRDQALKDQQTISDFRLREEQRKAEDLKKDYEQLKSRFDEHEKPVDRSISSVSEAAGRSADKSIPRFETATLSAPQSGMQNTTGSRSGEGASSSVGSGTIQDLSSGNTSSAAGAKASSAQKEMNDARLSMNLVVIASSSDRASDDPNKVLINFLTKNEPTVTQLQELKTSGLLYTEEDVTVEGKKVHTKKLIKFSELSAEAKILIERKLATIEIQEVKRNYSRQALMLELFTISLKKSASRKI